MSLVQETPDGVVVVTCRLPTDVGSVHTRGVPDSVPSPSTVTEYLEREFARANVAAVGLALGTMALPMADTKVPLDFVEKVTVVPAGMRLPFTSTTLTVNVWEPPQ